MVSVGRALQRLMAPLARPLAVRRAQKALQVVPHKFKTPSTGYFYHGTTMYDMQRVVQSGGILLPEVTQFSSRAHDAMTYGMRRRNDLQVSQNIDAPMVLLQFPAADLWTHVDSAVFLPAISAALATGMMPMHAAYVEATAPIPLMWMTAESRMGIEGWLSQHHQVPNFTWLRPDMTHLFLHAATQPPESSLVHTS